MYVMNEGFRRAAMGYGRVAEATCRDLEYVLTKLHGIGLAYGMMKGTCISYAGDKVTYYPNNEELGVIQIEGMDNGVFYDFHLSKNGAWMRNGHIKGKERVSCTVLEFDMGFDCVGKNGVLAKSKAHAFLRLRIENEPGMGYMDFEISLTA